MKRKGFIGSMLGLAGLPLVAGKKERTLSCAGLGNGIVDEHGRKVTDQAVHIYDAEGNCFSDNDDLIIFDLNLDTGVAECHIIKDGMCAQIKSKTEAQAFFSKIHYDNGHLMERSTGFKIKEIILAPALQDRLVTKLYTATVTLRAPLTYKVKKL